MNKIKEVISSIFISNGKISAKRVFGAIGFMSALFVICIWKQENITELLYSSCALLGIGVLNGKIKN